MTDSPWSKTVESVGATADFTAQVLDPRGAVISGAGVTWRTLNSTVAEQVSGGQFRARANGAEAFSY